MSQPTKPGDGAVIRRPTQARFTARKAPEPQAGSAESLLGTPQPKSDRVTSRRREISGDLPSWDLLPPGEINVRRK